MSKSQAETAGGTKTKKRKQSSGEDEYGAHQIQVLKGLDPVRKRPGMYIGGRGKTALHHMINEIVDNSVDEALAGKCGRIEVTLLPDCGVRIADDGRGIPVDIHKAEKKSGLELAMTVLHAGGKFDNQGQGSYKVSGGLHGVGLSVVNALSHRMIATVERAGRVHVLECSRGVPAGPLKTTGKTARTGTTVEFYPDPEIFEQPLEWDFEWVRERLREKAYLVSGLELVLRDHRTEEKSEECFHFKNGLAEMVVHLNEDRSPLHPKVLHLAGASGDVFVEAALQYVTEEEETFRSFANNIFTPLGGTHETGLRAAMTSVLSGVYAQYATKEEQKLDVKGDDFRDGLVCILSVRLSDPQFESQTKERLLNSEVRGYVQSFVTEQLRTLLGKDKKAARAIVEKAVRAARARIAQKKARERARAEKSGLETGILPGKLADCTSNDTDRTEIFLVEGDSAGGSAKQGRDRNFQAILPLKGKILNVEKARASKILDNDEIGAIVTALGIGFLKTFDADALRYGKVIIMTDADVDGSHIRTLLLTLFFRRMRELVEQGKIFIAQPPLYRVKRGKEVHYAYSDEERQRIMGKAGSEAKWEVSRYKGLGEMNPEQLWETTMNPATRMLWRVRLEDAVLADRTFQTLMGNDIASRKEWLGRNADLSAVEL